MKTLIRRRTPRLIWVFAGRTGRFVGFVVRRLIYNYCSWTDSIKTRMVYIHLLCDFLSSKGLPFPNLFQPPHDKTNNMVRAPSDNSDQPEHPPSLIRVFSVRMKKPWVLSYPSSAQRRLWSDWADTQAELSLRWARMPFCWFCHEAAHFKFHTLILNFLNISVTI